MELAQVYRLAIVEKAEAQNNVVVTEIISSEAPQSVNVSPDLDDMDPEILSFLEKVKAAHGSLLGENWGRVSNAWDIPFPVCMAIPDL